MIGTEEFRRERDILRLLAIVPSLQSVPTETQFITFTRPNATAEAEFGESRAITQIFKILYFLPEMWRDLVAYEENHAIRSPQRSKMLTSRMWAYY